MDFKEFSSLVMSRQACRSFLPKLVEREKLQQICDLARFSPSACNSQPWKMYCVSTKDKIEKVTESLQDNGYNRFLDNAGGYIVVGEVEATLKASVSGKFDNNHFVKYDIGELIAYITLCAKTLGLETCVIGYVNKDKLRLAIDMPENENCNLVVAVGYSDIAIREKSRKPFEQTVVEI